MINPLVSLREVSKCFDTPDGELQVLKGITLSIHKGEFVTVIGPSGCGKTTILKIIAGFETCDGLNIFEDEKITGPSPKRAVVFQDYALFPWKSLLENVQVGLRSKKVRGEELQKKGLDVLSRVGLSGFEDRFPHQISGGMKQRVAIARVLAMEPSVVLLDEPMGALDSLTRSTMQKELLDLFEFKDMGVFLITHSIEEAVFMSDRILVMSSMPGEIVEEYKIDLPRPRQREMLDTQEAINIQKELRQQLFTCSN